MQTVLVTADAVRADHLGQYGYRRDTMPVLDRLAAGGTVYDAAYANGPHSGVSIPSLLTSRYRGHAALADGPNVATALADDDCRTAMFHSNTMVAGALAGAAGFDDVVDFGVAGTAAADRRGATGGDGQAEGRTTLGRPALARLLDRAKAHAPSALRRSRLVRALHDRVVPADHRFDFQVYVDAETLTDRVQSWLVRHGDAPFFCWVHYMDPHRPYGIGPEDPRYVDGGPADAPDAATIRSLMARAGQEPETITAEERELLVDLYDSDLRHTAAHLERLLDALEAHADPPPDAGDHTDPLVVFTADHGEAFGEHGSYFHRTHPYDELLHVPLVVGGPGAGGSAERVGAQRPLVDVAPTICAHHGVEVPDDFRGRPLGAHSGVESRSVVASGSLATEAPVAAVRADGWKYIHVGDGPEECYDLTADPGEQANVAGTTPERVAALRETIPPALFEPPADGPAEAVGTDAGGASGAARRRLDALGYLE